MKKIYVLFSSPSSFYGKIVSLVTRNRISHCAILIKDKKESIVYESSIKTGIRKVELSKWLLEKTNVWESSLYKISDEEVLGGILKMSKKRYPTKMELFIRFFRKPMNIEGVHCAQYVKEVLHLRFPFITRTVLPQDIAMRFEKINKIQ